MGNIMSDISAELHMMMDNYIKLRDKDPTIELLKLVIPHRDGLGFDFTEEYRNKYVRNSDQHMIYSYMRYNTDLRKAILA